MPPLPAFTVIFAVSTKGAAMAGISFSLRFAFPFGSQVKSNRFSPTSSLKRRPTCPSHTWRKSSRVALMTAEEEVAGVDLSGDRIADGDVEMEIGRPVLPAHVFH